MKSNTIAILLGGLAPAFLFAGSSTMQKVAARTGIGTGPSLAATGLAIMACGGVATLLERNAGLGRGACSPRSASVCSGGRASPASRSP